MKTLNAIVYLRNFDVDEAPVICSKEANNGRLIPVKLIVRRHKLRRGSDYGSEPLDAAASLTSGMSDRSFAPCPCAKLLTRCML